MNKNVEEALKTLSNSLFEMDEVKHYFALKQAILDDKELLEINELMRKHQKLMVESINDPEVHKKEKELYFEYKNKYESHPLVVNYEVIKEEVFNILKQISNIINN